MGKKHNKFTKMSQYDDYDENDFKKNHNKSKKKAKESFEDEFFEELDSLKQKGSNRYLNKKYKDKNKHSKYDDWY